MALEVRLAVTQSYHGPDGEVVYDVGTLLAPGDAPDDVRVRPVAVEVAKKPAGAPAKPPAKSTDAA